MSFFNTSHGRLIIDADILLWKFSSGNTHETVVDGYAGGRQLGKVATSHCRVERAAMDFDDAVEAMCQKFTPKAVVLPLTDPDSNFRKTVMLTYKSNRGGPVAKPLGYWLLREYVIDKYETAVAPGLEGDDLIGLMLTDPHSGFETQVAASIDKDMRTLPGTHWDWDKRKLFTVTQAQADEFHLFQTLMGDAVDGYPGCKGVGKIKARRLIDAHGATWGTVLAAYDKAGLTAADALENARVAHILRYGDYDDNGVRLWTPPDEQKENR